jgi:hypothetical protein
VEFDYDAALMALGHIILVPSEPAPRSREGSLLIAFPNALARASMNGVGLLK